MTFIEKYFLDRKVNKIKKMFKYPKPDRCPMPDFIWYDPLGYCWGCALAIDENRLDDFLKNNCRPEECKKEGF